MVDRTDLAESSRAEGVEGNTRLTAGLGALLLVLLAIEGVTILRIGSLLSLHVIVGALLLPPVLVKVGSTFYRMARYYTRSRAYRVKGPPAMILRLLGPVVVLLTVEVLATGVALLYLGGSWRGGLLFLHKAGFILWLGAMTIHVLGHLTETVRESWRDWLPSRSQPAGVGMRRLLIVGGLVLGGLLAFLLAGHVNGFTSGRFQ